MSSPPGQDRNRAATDGPQRSGVFSSFRIQSFRFQWLADIFSAWGAEMETIILGWYVLVETNSAFLVSLVAALRFAGTLIAPMAGVVADRYDRRSLLIGLRVSYLLLAASLAAAALAGTLPLAWVFVVAGLAGLIRPSEMIIRQSLIADTVPRSLLTNALGFGRTTIEGARVIGALAGAALLSLLGIGPDMSASPRPTCSASCSRFVSRCRRVSRSAGRRGRWRS